ncbi:C-type lectin domain family 4 member E-like [Pygocentrus nattereri]|uniref:C-type lectin domain-containing protein n=1 Tax=Pygocentrus nattereri TaxID=42514 RepID=A0AAR2M560_PYGNA|nr:C-type lectin domain family 4 member E-like [Pygocentrus nattereri]
MGIFKQTDHGNQTPNMPVKTEEELKPPNDDKQTVKCYRTATYYFALLCFLLAVVSFLEAFYSVQITVSFKGQMAEQEGRFRDLTGKCDALNRSYNNLFHRYPELNQHCTTNKTSNLRECKPCPEGWEPFMQKCYLFVSERKDWMSSQYLCLSVGGHLATVKNEEEQKFLCRKAEDFSQGDSYWLGLANMNPDGAWLWVDGTPVDDAEQFWDWSPVNGKNKDLCARMTPGGSYRTTWFTSSCKNGLKRICERSQGSVVL